MFRLAFSAQDDVRQRSSYSHFLLCELVNAFGEVDVFAPLKRPCAAQIPYVAPKIFWHHLLRRGFPVFCEPPVIRQLARSLERQFNKAGSSLILSRDPIPFAAVAPKVPYVLYWDMTIAAARRLGWYFEGWLQQSLDKYERADAAAVAGAKAAIYSSEWAAKSAIDDYGADPVKVHIVPLGANIEHPEVDPSSIAREPTGTCRLLFYGIDWRRKGGDIACETLYALTRLGIDAQLTVCGPARLPAKWADVTHIHFLPQIDKNRNDGLPQLAEMLRQHDYLILPTRADCTPDAIAEAAAFGLPSVAADVGGVASMIQPGISGILMPAEAGASDYAQCIAANFSDADSFVRLRRAARQMYERQLNWKTSAGRIAELLRTISPV